MNILLDILLDQYLETFCLLLVLCRTTNYCLNLAAEQEKTVTENWLQELDVAIGTAKHCLDEECKYVRGLVSKFSSLIICSAVCSR